MTDKIKAEIRNYRNGVPRQRAIMLVDQSYGLGYAKAVQDLSTVSSIELILKVVEEELGVTLTEMKAINKAVAIVDARKIAGKLLYDLLKSVQKAGRVIDRDHGTILYYINTFNAYLMSCPCFRLKYKKVITKINFYKTNI